MSEEEKEAIEEAKRQIEEVHNLNELNVFMTDSTTLKTLLNYIDKLQKDNYKLDRENQLIFEKNVELQKENEQYEEIKNLISKEKLFDIDYIKEFFIDKDKIRDKIIELEEELQYDITKNEAKLQIEVLQELLEGK